MKLNEIRTYSIYSKLANVLAEKGFGNMPEIENIIENYFKLWLSDLKDENKFSNHIIEERNKIYTEKYGLEITRNNLEQQLLTANAKKELGEAVDKLWLARLNTATRIVKGKIVKCQNKLSNLKTIEKQHNIEVNNKKVKDHQQQMLSTIKLLLKEERGKEYLNELMAKAKLKVDEINNL